MFNKPIEEHVLELDESIQNRIAGFITQGACIIETSDPVIVMKKLGEIIQPTYQILGNGVESTFLKKQQGRPIIRWDAKTFRKNDAIGSMYTISKYPKEPKPIVIIDHITEIPEAVSNIFDDPELIENILLHSWKNDIIYLTHPEYGPFQMNRTDYSVLFPVMPGSLSRLRHRPDGIAVTAF